MADLLQVSDLEKAKLHDTFHSEVITGKAGGLSTGANIDYATNAVTGQVQKTLSKILDDFGWSYVGWFADGVTFTDKTDFAVDAVGTQWIYTGSLPFSAAAGTVPSEPTYQVVHVKSASAISNANGGSVQDFIDSFALKIFQSTTNGGLTEIQTRTVDAGEVYEVRKTSDDSLATIYSDAAGATEIVQNGAGNVSGSDGVVEFYIADGDYYIEVGGVLNEFSTVEAYPYNSIKSLSEKAFAKKVKVESFWADSFGGGGLFTWVSNADKSTHDGGTIIDPDKLSSLGEITDADPYNDYFTPSPTGTGCYVRDTSGDPFGYVSAGWFGGSVGRATKPLKAAQDYLSSYDDVIIDLNDIDVSIELTGIENAIYLEGRSSVSMLTNSCKIKDLTVDDSQEKSIFRFEDVRSLSNTGEIYVEGSRVETIASEPFGSDVFFLLGVDDIDLTIKSKGNRSPSTINQGLTHSSKKVKLKLDSDTDHYGHITWNCDDVTINSVAVGCYRSFFLSGTSNLKMNSHSKGQVGTSLVKQYGNSNDMNNLDLNISMSLPTLELTGGGVVNGSPFSIEVQSDTPVAMTNISAVVSIDGRESNTSTLWDKGITLVNRLANGSSNNTGLGHVLDNINISGFCYMKTGSAPILFPSGSSFPSPDKLSGIKCGDLETKGGNIIVSYENDGLVNFDSVSTEGSLILINGGSGRFSASNSMAGSFSPLSLGVHYNNCIISGMANMSAQGASYQNCIIGGYDVNRGYNNNTQTVSKYITSNLPQSPSNMFKFKGTVRAYGVIKYTAYEDFLDTSTNFTRGEVSFKITCNPSGSIRVYTVTEDIKEFIGNTTSLSVTASSGSREGYIDIAFLGYDKANAKCDLHLEVSGEWGDYVFSAI